MPIEEAPEAEDASPVQRAWDEFTHGHRGYLAGSDAFHAGFAAGVAEGIRQAREAALEYSRLAQEQSNQAKDSGAHRLADMAFGRSVGAEHVAERLDALGTRD